MGLLLLALVLSVDPPAEGHFIADPSDAVSAGAKGEVDELAATIHVGGFGELMVLVVQNTGHVPLQKFAHDVFSTWPVGHAENVDGALLVLSLQDKKSTLLLGDGYRHLSAKQTDALLESAVTPALKAGKVDDAAMGGARAVLKMLEENKHTAKDGG